ncbi:MAG TPA: bacitracin ABC transporter ATP-binding protein [Desulfosporosinus sp.]|jgi:ABC-2 type transport system ATP-binding protein|nr:bacitracin ABC transporter ATP-binding protein [Desulfosporosinus sp.]
MLTTPIVQFKHITKKIHKKVIIDDISFEVYAGEVFGFLGPNGAGKTTAIRMLFGLIPVTKGDILINGYSIKDDYEKAIVHVGGIIENPEMYKYLSGYQNLAQYARMYKTIARNRIEEVIDLVGLKNRAHDKVKTYSLGMRQRLGLAQALLHKPSLIVLDEPTNGLDPSGIRELRDHLRMLAREQSIAILVSSHLLTEMELMCDRIGIIQDGKLVDIQSVNDLLVNQKIVRVKFTVDNVLKAKLCLAKMSYAEETMTLTNENTLELVIDSNQIPDIIVSFVQEGIKVFGADRTTKTLEDRFLEMTGGDEIAQNAQPNLKRNYQDS